jgi:hypothetical protein
VRTWAASVNTPCSEISPLLLDASRRWRSAVACICPLLVASRTSPVTSLTLTAPLLDLTFTSTPAGRSIV